MPMEAGTVTRPGKLSKLRNRLCTDRLVEAKRLPPVRLRPIGFGLPWRGLGKGKDMQAEEVLGMIRASGRFGYNPRLWSEETDRVLEVLMGMGTIRRSTEDEEPMNACFIYRLAEEGKGEAEY